MKLDKTLVDKVIRVTKKYFETSDRYYLLKLREAKDDLKESVSWKVADLIQDLAKYTQESGNGTYNDIYKALAVFGIIVEYKENRK